VRLDHDVLVCTIKKVGVIGQSLIEQDIRVIDLASYGGSRYLRSMPLRRLLKSEGVGVLHSHGTAALAEGALGTSFIQRVKHVHTFHFGNYPAISPGDHRLERFFHGCPDTLVAVGYSQKEALIETYGIREARIQVVHNGVNSKVAVPDERVTRLRKPGRVLIGSVSSLTEQKGLPCLLDSFCRLIDQGCPVDLAIVGDGELRQSLEKKADDLGIADRVHFLGWIADASKTVLPALDIFVQSSLWEAMSIVLLEACACGLPIVATDVGDNARVIEHNRSGMIVPPNNVDALTNALHELTTTGSLRRTLGRTALDIYSRHYTTMAMVDRYIRIYEKLNG